MDKNSLPVMFYEFYAELHYIFMKSNKGNI